MAMRHHNHEPEHKEIQKDIQRDEYSLAEVSALLHHSRSFAYKAKNKFLAGKKGGLEAYQDAQGDWRVSAAVFEAFRAQMEREESHKPKSLLDKQELRRLQSELGGVMSSLRHTSDEISAQLMAGQQAKFERLADPDGTLRYSNPREFSRRVEGYRKAHMLRMRIASVKKRAARREVDEAEEVREGEETAEEELEEE